ncbi:MAG: CRISPR-associated helicase Cas3' [Archaeoglobaceae archaeon]
MLREYLDSVSKRWYNLKPRAFVEFAIEEIERYWNENNFFVIEAPTGYGKSTISASLALYSIEEEFKCIVTYPLRSLLEDQFKKFAKLAKEEFVGKRYMHNPDSPYLIKPITLTTVDTLSLNLFGISPEDLEKVYAEKSYGHYFFAIASVVFSNLILDEVHLLADSTKSLSFLVSLLKIAKKFDQRVFLMSATLPSALKIKLEENGLGRFISFDKTSDRDFYSQRVEKKYKIEIECLNTAEKFERILDWTKDDNFSKALIIFNTIEEAVKFYDFLSENGQEALLIHSRFVERDREEKIEKLKKNRIVIATQVVEAGVDISSDLLISDIAPASSLIQRFGRFLRYEEEGGNIFVWFEKTEKDEFYKVYNKDLVEKTLKWLKENSNELKVHLPSVDNGKGYAEFLEAVYTQEDFKIDRKVVEELESIHWNLEGISKKSIDILFNMMGSFVREGIQIPVTVERNGEAFKASKFVKECVVPLSLRNFKKANVQGIYTKEGNQIKLSRKGLVEKLNKSDPRIVYRAILKENIVAFLIDGFYDSKSGLRL